MRPVPCAHGCKILSFRINRTTHKCYQMISVTKVHRGILTRKTCWGSCPGKSQARPYHYFFLTHFHCSKLCQLLNLLISSRYKPIHHWYFPLKGIYFSLYFLWPHDPCLPSSFPSQHASLNECLLTLIEQPKIFAKHKSYHILLTLISSVAF